MLRTAKISSLKLRSGFTLIELMIVIAIIGILVAISTAGLLGARASSRDSQRKADIEDIRSALEMYKADCGTYPTSTSDLTGGTCMSNKYMSQLPADPYAARGWVYNYVPGTGNKSYTIYAHLEHPGTCTNCGSVSCGTGAACNYSKTNP